ncbi:MAG: VWA domain-containing protein, partial [candidate division Zixibacteria bacterium]|nr:VWA domain-containing protein [candidate division Zixibacteria bacterium]
GAPFIKKFREERELLVMLLVDLSASGHFGTVNRAKNQVAAEAAAILAFSAIKNNDKVGMIVFTDQIELFIPPKKGRSHVLRLIREILYFEPKGRGTNITLALEFLGKVARRKSVAFLISDFFDKGYERNLAVAHRRHDVIAVQVTDPRERLWVDVGLIEMEDYETGRRMVIDTSNPRARSSFERTVTLTEQRRKRFFDSISLDTVTVSTERPIADGLIRFFRQRERRRR